MANYTKTIIIPEANIPELVEVYGEGHNPALGQSKAAFANDQLTQEIHAQIKNRVISYRRRLIQQTVDQNFEIT